MSDLHSMPPLAGADAELFTAAAAYWTAKATADAQDRLCEAVPSPEADEAWEVAYARQLVLGGQAAKISPQTVAGLAAKLRVVRDMTAVNAADFAGLAEFDQHMHRLLDEAVMLLGGDA